MEALVCGAGIAGLTTAWWLARDGHQVTLVEQAPSLRDEGYMLDFFGSGWDVAERMGLLGALARVHRCIPELVFAGAGGRAHVALEYPKLRARVFGGHHFNFLRGELERVLFEALPASVERCFGERVASVEQAGDRVHVTLEDGRTRSADLLVGADGVRSRVRASLFGEGAGLRDLGFRAAAYIIDDAELAARFAGRFVTMTVPDRQVAVYALGGARVATLFVHRTAIEPREGSSREILRAVHGDLGWVVPRLLERMPPDERVYFDAVLQVELERWSAGRVVLVGDACDAVSLLAGQGASMAMGGAWALSRALAGAGSIEEKLRRYEARVRPAAERKQEAGRRTARWFVPRSRVRIGVRDLALWLALRPGMSWILRRSVSQESIVS